MNEVNRLDTFFEGFKNLPNSYKIEHVHQLLNNPHAKATHKVNSHFKHFKLIIMTSAFIIGISTLLFYNTKVEVKQVSVEPLSGESEVCIQKSDIQFETCKGEIMPNNTSPGEAKDSPKRIETVKEKTEEYIKSALPLADEVEKSQPATKITEQALSNSEPQEVPLEEESVDKNEIPLIQVPIIDLSQPEMEDLGFKFYKDSIVFTFYDGCNKYVTQHDSATYYIPEDSARLIKDAGQRPFLLHQFEEMKNRGVNQFSYETTRAFAKICGKLNLDDNTKILIRAFTEYNTSEFDATWLYDQDKIDGYYPEMSVGDIDLDLLVPVRCQIDDPVLSTQFNNHVFWMYPNDELFKRLPKRLSGDIKREFDILQSDELVIHKTGPSCTFYEVCKSNLHLHDFRLYPNPAKYSATIEFNLDEDVDGSISIVNITGAELKTLVPYSTFQSGQNRYQLDLSGIKPGIYLISVNTEKGFQTQRLMVSY